MFAEGDDYADQSLDSKDKRKERKEAKAKAKILKKITGPTAHSSVDLMTFRRKPVGAVAAPDIHLSHIDLNFGSKFLLQDAELHLSRGRRYGLVGRNGAGKTTLMRSISARDLDIPKSVRVLHVEQEASGDDTSVLDCVLSADIERSELLAQEKLEGARENVDVSLVQRIYARLQEIESDQAPMRAAKILHGLGFSTTDQRRATKEFSGGWRMRLALARALFCQSECDLLILDEPTNCLDYKSKLWLQQRLVEWDKSLLVVSHDRTFLNAGVVQHIIHLHAAKLTMYKGNYDEFERTRNERLRQQAKAHAAQEAYVAHIQQFVDRFRFNAKRAPLVQSRLKALSKLEAIPAVAEDPDFQFSFPACDELFGALVEFRDVTFQYPGAPRPIFQHLNTVFTNDARICITGQNGQGKSTLLKLVLDDLSPTLGEIIQNPRLRIGRFSQHHIDMLDLTLTCVEFLRKNFPGSTEQEYRAHLGRYGLSGDTGLQPIHTLSGGQKSRMAFAWMSFTKPNLLLLDEPESHLDLETIDALAMALNDFNGAVVIVSHDERLVSLVCNEMWVVHDGEVIAWEKDWEAYKKQLLKELESDDGKMSILTKE